MSIVLRRVTAAVLIASSVVLVAACGGGGSPSASSAADVKLAAAPDLGVSVVVTGNDAAGYGPKIKDALTSAMTGAGYKLIDGGKGDVTAKVSVTATDVPSMFQMKVNGKVKKNWKIDVSASFVGTGDGAVVDQATCSFTADDGSVDSGAIRQLLGQLSNSGKLVAYSDSQKSRIAGAEDDLWKAGNVDGCSAAKKATDCDGVKAYIAKYPSGKHTADGRKALQDGDTSMAKATEDDMWAKASVDQCQKPTKSYDCKGVSDYLAKYPAGAHAADGKAAIDGSQKARDALAKKETANAKKASFDDCVKECKREYIDFRPGVFEILVQRCTQNECK